MFFIPTWITNFLLLATCWLSGYQLSQLQRANPIPTIQFPMVVFCLVLVWVVTMKNGINPWLSMAFFLIAVVNLAVIVRQHRMLPPKKRLR